MRKTKIVVGFCCFSFFFLSFFALLSHFMINKMCLLAVHIRHSTWAIKMFTQLTTPARDTPLRLEWDASIIAISSIEMVLQRISFLFGRARCESVAVACVCMRSKLRNCVKLASNKRLEILYNTQYENRMPAHWVSESARSECCVCVWMRQHEACLHGDNWH